MDGRVVLTLARAGETIVHSGSLGSSGSSSLSSVSIMTSAGGVSAFSGAAAIAGNVRAACSPSGSGVSVRVTVVVVGLSAAGGGGGCGAIGLMRKLYSSSFSGNFRRGHGSSQPPKSSIDGVADRGPSSVELRRPLEFCRVTLAGLIGLSFDTGVSGEGMLRLRGVPMDDSRFTSGEAGSGVPLLVRLERDRLLWVTKARKRCFSACSHLLWRMQISSSERSSICG